VNIWSWVFQFFQHFYLKLQASPPNTDYHSPHVSRGPTRPGTGLRIKATGPTLVMRGRSKKF